MKIERARLRDTPALAWVAAQAFAAESTKTSVRRRAGGLYMMHLYCLALLTCGGRLWHWEKRAIIAIEPKKRRPLWKWLAAVGLCAAVAIGLEAWISMADARGLQVLLAVTKVVGAFVITGSLLLVPAIVPALRELHPKRAAQNAGALHQWKNTLAVREAYKISYLAMYPQTGEGLAFARTAINHVVPDGAALYTEARSERHKAIYAHRGFQPLATANGTPTLAMGTR